MVCMRAAFHKNDRNYGNDENDEDGVDSYRLLGVECWVNGNHGNHGNGETTGIRGANHEFPKQRV